MSKTKNRGRHSGGNFSTSNFGASNFGADKPGPGRPKILIFILVGLGAIFMAAMVFAIYVSFLLPTEQEIRGCLVTKTSQVQLCPTTKNYVSLDQISPHVIHAVIVSEDSNFYTHRGFDQEGIERCLEKLKTNLEVKCGGSTITQQLAKNLFLSNQKTFFRKFIEALITVKIERTLSKRQILEKYMNVIQFGKGLYGIKAASNYYFKKSPSALNPLESAFLAMVLPSPERYAVSFYKKNLTRYATDRISKILKFMWIRKFIDEEAYLSAKNQIAGFLRETPPSKPYDVIPDEASSEDALSEEDLSKALVEGGSSGQATPGDAALPVGASLPVGAAPSIPPTSAPSSDDTRAVDKIKPEEKNQTLEKTNPTETPAPLTN